MNDVVTIANGQSSESSIAPGTLLGSLPGSSYNIPKQIPFAVVASAMANSIIAAANGIFQPVGNYQPAGSYQAQSAILTAFANTASAAGVLTNDGSGQLSYGISPAMVKLSSGNISSQVATVSIVHSSYTGYSGFVYKFDNFIPSVDSSNLYFITSTNGGSSYDNSSGAYKWGFTGYYSTAATSQAASDSDTKVAVCVNVGNGAAEGVNLEITMRQTSNNSIKPRYGFITDMYDQGDHSVRVVGEGIRMNPQKTDAIQVFFATGNVVSGSYTLYGII